MKFSLTFGVLVLLGASVLPSCGSPIASAPPPPPRAAVVSGPADPVFVDVAARAGLTTVLHGGGPDKDHILESVGSGCAFVDYDGDGRLDVYLVNAWALDENPSRVRLKGRNAL